MRAANIRAADMAKRVGYSNVSAMYKAMRYEQVPDWERAVVIAGLIDKTPGDVIALWHRERGKRRTA